MSQGNGLSKHMFISWLKPAERNDIHIAVQQVSEIALKMNLIEDKSTRTELDKKVNVGVVAILAAGYRAKHLDVHGMPTRQETFDLLSMRVHDVPNLTHEWILTERATFTFGMINILPARTNPHRSGVNQTGGSPSPRSPCRGCEPPPRATSTPQRCQAHAGRPHASQGNGLSKQMLISWLKPAEWNDIYIAVQKRPEIAL